MVLVSPEEQEFQILLHLITKQFSILPQFILNELCLVEDHLLCLSTSYSPVLKEPSELQNAPPAGLPHQPRVVVMLTDEEGAVDTRLPQHELSCKTRNGFS